MDEVIVDMRYPSGKLLLRLPEALNTYSVADLKKLLIPFVKNVDYWSRDVCATHNREQLAKIDSAIKEWADVCENGGSLIEQRKANAVVKMWRELVERYVW